MSNESRISKLERAIRMLEGSIAKVRQDIETGNRPQSTPSQDAKSRKSEIPFSSKSGPDTDNENRVATRWYQSPRWWSGLLKISKRGLEALGILFAIGYAIVTYFEWKDLRHNFEVEQRAWIKAEVNMPATLDPKDVVVVVARNIGKSPALKFQGGVIFEVVDANRPPSFPPGRVQMRQSAGRMIFPSDSISFESGLTPTPPDMISQPLTPAEIRSLSSGDAYLVAFGTLVYQDQFGQHWTRFCSWKSFQIGPRDFDSGECVNWNSVGDGPVKWEGPSQQNAQE